MRSQFVCLFIFLFSTSCFQRRTSEPLTAAERICGKFNNDKSQDALIQCLRTLPHQNIKKDPLIKKYIETHHAYISVTSSPERLGKLKTTLSTIDESLFDIIFVVLPLRYKNKEEYSEIDIKNIKDFSDKVQVIRPEVDLGPVTKIIPTIEYVKTLDPKGIVVSIDDDIGYSIGTFGELLKAIIQSPYPIVAGTVGQEASYWNITSVKNVFANKCIPNKGPCDILEGFGAIAYVAGTVPVENIKAFSKVSRVCKLGDDVVISYAMGLAKIERRKIRNQFTAGISAFTFGFQEDALHNQNDYFDSYRQCVLDIESKYK